MKHLLFSLLFLFHVNILSAEATSEEIPEKKYGIYLTTGAQAHKFANFEWGGCHITLAGFHPKNGNEALLNKIPQIIKDCSPARKEWKPRHVRLQKWGEQWAVVFHSRILNKIARELSKEGFKRVKGPEFADSSFHMVLPHLKARQAAEAFARNLRSKKWFITVVELKPSDPSFIQANWLKYYQLHNIGD